MTFHGMPVKIKISNIFQTGLEEYLHSFSNLLTLFLGGGGGGANMIGNDLLAAYEPFKYNYFIQFLIRSLKTPPLPGVKGTPTCIGLKDIRPHQSWHIMNKFAQKCILRWAIIGSSTKICLPAPIQQGRFHTIVAKLKIYFVYYSYILTLEGEDII